MAGCATAPPVEPPPPQDTAMPVAAPALAPVAEATVAQAEPAAPGDSPAQPAPSEATATPSDPLRPGVYVDLDDRSARRDLWERVRQGFAMPTLDGEVVTQHEQWYSSRP